MKRKTKKKNEKKRRVTVYIDELNNIDERG